ncbi:hypothetical protein [Streptomyces sp. ITFR-16]|uniref:hypothetical protein n=1 Tax=Streptomyces sp. ITFR-16 TaxID=3075198 RepID=UPI00288B3DC5|nr:hypothetical protein [Streptomyces sp. ITFR-16]WNI22170.1 hypothetical protein RLT58_09550 [Streptomyces sp. ITFR-16]
MHTVKHWFNHSLAAQALVLFVLGLGLGAVFRRDDHPALWAVQSLLCTAVVIGILAYQRRRTSRATGARPSAVVDLNRRIRRREVPRDPEERAMMRRLVDEQLGKMERGGRWLPYWLGLVAVGMLVLGATTGSPAFPVVFAVGVVVFCTWILWMRRRAMEMHHHMRSALRERG